MAHSAMPDDHRTAQVKVLVTKSLKIDEPDWCVGHAGDRAEFKVDITHYGPEHSIEINGITTCRAMLAQSPYSETSSPAPVLYVEDGDITGSYTPDEVEQLADALTETATRLRTLGRNLAEILDGGTA
ncbi:DUF6907 domain-containing protein [Streptomyces cylindrosporus]|uniref:Uncharacterized protein n=1 Tax=Streptomyces cylindrosporus TaxID=2927583 RepID=A0ABS9Y879_9ACTN|nr:hypothetical protein [Streptomyces cylindrosporus]MCI3272131.1 hypothetical protein [Streptomyces cylindrosporus]